MINELKAKWNTKKSIREIKVASYYMCKNYFFNYHRKYKFDILKLLKVSRKRVLDIITDTRDLYSHYLEDKDKKNRLKKGPEMAIYFNIICYVVRTYLIDQIKIKYDEERLIEYYFTLHDWILDIQEKKGQLKSKAYKMNEEFSKIRDRI